MDPLDMDPLDMDPLNTTPLKIPIRYAPNSLSKKDRTTQLNSLIKSRKLYKRHKYYTRKPVASYKHKLSKHLLHARTLYQVQSVYPNKELARKTGCKLAALKHIVKKGEGAYYSSGSRPNQTPQSWGLARLASAVTAGNAAAVDYDIIKKGCNHHKKAFILAQRSKKRRDRGL